MSEIPEGSRDSFITDGPSYRLIDPRQEQHQAPCRDCGRTHLQGEHLAMIVPTPEGGTRVAWEGCVDCWIIRTSPPTKEP